MTVWIEKLDNEFADDYTFAAFLGFRHLGSIIKPFHKPEKIFYRPGDVVVGCLQSMRFMARKLDIELPNFYIPNPLWEFAGRKITKSTIGAVVAGLPHTNLFIKPIKTKEFPAQVVTTMPLITYMGQNFQDSMECWTSEVLDFVSEYRIFLLKDKPVGCKHYWGDYRITLDWKVVDAALAVLQNPPAGWCLDFGVTSDGRTLLIEANDGYSIGNYGLEGIDYATLLRNRWWELTKHTKPNNLDKTDV